MGSIVLGVTASHSTLMNTHWHELVHVDRAMRFKNALKEAREALLAARPDIVVIIGSNHFRGMFLDLMPTFTLGVGECVGLGESGTPGGSQRTDPEFAHRIADHLVETEFDIAFSARLQVDHGIMHAVQYLLAGVEIPIVPVIINVFAPPLPSLHRCHRFGVELRKAIEGMADGRRVAVVASGGLSHRLPWPDWRAPKFDDEEFMVEAWLNGRGHWKEYEARRREIVVKAASRAKSDESISPEFDRAFLAAWLNGDIDGFLDMSTADLQAHAGNGGQEIRSWIAAKSAIGSARARVLAYEAIPEWLTGMAVSILEPCAPSASL